MTPYFLLFLGFLLALFGTFYKSTETDEKGSTLYTKYRLPVLTKVGKLVCALLAISFGASLYMTWNSSKENEESKNNLKTELDRVQRQNENLQTNIRRMLDPIRDVAITFDVNLALSHPSLEGYRTRLQDGVRESLKNFHDNNAVEKYPSAVHRTTDSLDPPPKILGLPEQNPQRQKLNYDLYVNYISEKGSVVRVGVPAKSELFPKVKEETTAYYALNFIQIEINLFREPVDLDHDFAGLCCPDLTWPVDVTLDAVLREPKNEVVSRQAFLFYDLNVREAAVMGWFVKIDPAFWKNSNGQITSVQDLAGSQMVIRIGIAPLQSGQPDVRQNVDKIRRSFDMNYLGITMSGGRKFAFKRYELRRYSNETGTYYAATFPKRL